jgi:hypothetical protein
MSRQTTLVGAAVVLLAGAAAAGALLLTRGSSGPPTVPVPGAKGFPAPPLGAVVFSRELGPLALALAAVPQPGQVLLQASVLGPPGADANRLEIAFAVQGSSKRAHDCGDGCYRATLPVQGRPRAVDVEVGGEQSTHWHVALPASWPPRTASALVARAGRAWRSLQSLRYSEFLASDPTHSLRSTWWAQAPDRIAYETSTGTAGIIVGGRRWDKVRGAKSWTPSPQSRVRQPTPFWAAVADAYVLGDAVVRGRPVWRVSFFDPKTPAWFTAAVDRATYRTLDLRMITTSHFMHDVYGSFNRAPAVRPPGG